MHKEAKITQERLSSKVFLGKTTISDYKRKKTKNQL